MPVKAVLLYECGGDWVKFIAGRVDLTVVYADEGEDKITIAQQFGGCRQCGAGGDDVIVDYNPPLGDGPEQMKVGSQAVAVDTLNGIGIERNAESVRYALTYRSGEVEPVCMTAPGRGDDTPIFRIVDKTLNEVAGCLGKQSGSIGRVLYLAEWRSALGTLKLGEIHQGAEMVQDSPGRQITKRDIPTLQPRPRGRNIPIIHAYYLTASAHSPCSQICALCRLQQAYIAKVLYKPPHQPFARFCQIPAFP